MVRVSVRLVIGLGLGLEFVLGLELGLRSPHGRSGTGRMPVREERRACCPYCIHSLDKKTLGLGR